jgi:hypothetical protein
MDFLQLLRRIPNPFASGDETSSQPPRHETPPPAQGSAPPVVEAQPQPAAEPEQQSLRDRYMAQAYGALGVDQQTFQTMDPVERNTLINGAYAQMYMDNPDTMKWAGMAAYASETVGAGMMQAQALDIPGVQQLTGAPSGDRVAEIFAQGNGELFEDIYWQHLAFQQGGIEELRRAAEETPGSIDERQLECWATIAAGQEALADARESGDDAAIQAAQDQIWQGNGDLLQFEQREFLREHVYESAPDARDATRFLSSDWNVAGVGSPIPGGESFNDFRDRTGATGTPDVGDTDQRWDWISQSMLPSFRDRETNHNEDMMADMQRMVANRETGIPGLPLNTEDPLSSPMQLPTWVPRSLNLPDLPSLSDIGEMLDPRKLRNPFSGLF